MTITTAEQILVGATLLFLMFALFFIYQMFRDCQFKPSIIKLSDSESDINYTPQKTGQLNAEALARWQTRLSVDNAVKEGWIEEISFEEAIRVRGTDRALYTIGTTNDCPDILLNVRDICIRIDSGSNMFYDEEPEHYAEVV